MKASQVVGTLLDTDCSKDFVRAFILSVRAMAPSEQLSSRRWEAQSDSQAAARGARQREGVQEAAVHNALMKICTDMNNRPEEFPQHSIPRLQSRRRRVRLYRES